MHGNKLFFFFIDGIGLGEDNTERNPLTGLFSPFIGNRRFVRDSVPLYSRSAVLIPVDALLDVRGVPQSATGQTTIMTGINAAELLGYHLQAFPNQALLPLIREHSIFRKLRQSGIPATSANLYSRAFFRERKKKHRNMFPVSTLSIEAADIPFRYFEEYERGEAVFADITNHMLVERGYPVQTISPAQAGQRIVDILGQYDMVFFEYFLTDTHGHSRDRQKILHSVEVINEFLASIMERSDGTTDILVISDHGNAEDMLTGDHTFNPVPFLLLSTKGDLFASLCSEVHDLTDISPFILDYFGVAHGPDPGAAQDPPSASESGAAADPSQQQEPGATQDQTPADSR